MIDPRIPMLGQSPDMVGAVNSGLADGSNFAKLLIGSQVNRMRDLDGYGQQKAFADNNFFGRQLRGQLKQDQAAALQTQIAQQKAFADIDKTQSEAFKNNAQGQGYGLDNSGKKLGAIQGAFQQASMTGDKAQVLLGLNALVRTGMMSPEDYQSQAAIVGAMTPDELKQYAGGINFANAKDPAALQYQSADNAANNAQSDINNQRTTNASIYSTDVSAETADKNRAQSQSQFEQNYALNQQKAFFEQNKPIGFEVGNDGFKYAIYPNGKGIRVLGDDGQPIKVQQKSGAGKMTEQESKDALFGARMQESNKIINSLEGEGVKPPALSSMPILGNFANALPQIVGGASPKQQQYMQAQRDFINALLRKESGAVIGQDEFDSAQKQYFPQIGDSSAVIAQKAKNRELAMKMIVGSAGEQGGKNISQATGIPYANAGQQSPQSTFNLFD